jgi:hypothetical protein
VAEEENDSAVAIAVAVPLIAGAGFVAYLFLSKESADAAAAAQSMQPTFAPVEPMRPGFLDGIFGPGTDEALKVLGKTMAKEGSKLMSQAAKEVIGAVKTGAKASVAPAIEAYKAGKKAVPFVKAAAAPVSTSYKGAKGTVSAVSSAGRGVASFVRGR